MREGIGFLPFLFTSFAFLIVFWLGIGVLLEVVRGTPRFREIRVTKACTFFYQMGDAILSMAVLMIILGVLKIFVILIGGGIFGIGVLNTEDTEFIQREVSKPR